MKGVSFLDESACSLCGYPGPFPPFFPGASLRETRCPQCRSSRRTRDLVRVLLQECGLEPILLLREALQALRPWRIYELQAQGALHSRLRQLPRYTCSEYFPEYPSGSYNESGILCQDASRLSFADNSFDLVISQDVLEHMPDPWKGFTEIHRVLRPGGKHIFTVPLHEGRPTRQRARLDVSGNLEHPLPPVHHKDPLNPEGALVYWDYGDDLPDRLDSLGIAARCAAHAAFYAPGALCDIRDKVSHEAYLNAWKRNLHAAFFLYNSVVFVAEKHKVDEMDL